MLTSKHSSFAVFFLFFFPEKKKKVEVSRREDRISVLVNGQDAGVLYIREGRKENGVVELVV